MTPPRVVLDSNVVISAFLFGGPPARVLDCALAGAVQCFTPVPILDEVRDVLQRPKFGLSPAQAVALVEEFRDLCQVVTPAEKVRAVPADPDDNMILACASAAGASLIISGDAHLLSLGRWRAIRILSPAEFIREIC
ncbi:MAG: putative toxin-antitoxin system toxin component, PIN family [Candidatus Brocadiia bacterium]|jgi:putative PIN family toxin of toxin-antitoxin system